MELIEWEKGAKEPPFLSKMPTKEATVPKKKDLNKNKQPKEKVSPVPPAIPPKGKVPHVMSEILSNRPRLTFMPPKTSLLDLIGVPKLKSKEQINLQKKGTEKIHSIAKVNYWPVILDYWKPDAENPVTYNEYDYEDLENSLLNDLKPGTYEKWHGATDDKPENPNTIEITEEDLRGGSDSSLRDLKSVVRSYETLTGGRCVPLRRFANGLLLANRR